jgi:uncharacterized cupredoxin-like copper-binding protein
MHMADPPRSPDTGAAPHRGEGMPRWVKVFAIIGIVLALLAVVVLVTGGGGGHGPGRHLGAGGDTAPSSGHQSTSGGAGGPADATQAARTVKVTTLDAMTFQPSRINVSAGETVTFVVTNTGRAVHDFTLGDAAMQQQHADAMAHIPAGMAHDSPNSVTLPRGEAKQLTWRFGDTATLEYGCHQPRHYQAGMRGQITVA